MKTIFLIEKYFKFIYIYIYIYQQIKIAHGPTGITPQLRMGISPGMQDLPNCHSAIYQKVHTWQRVFFLQRWLEEVDWGWEKFWSDPKP